MKETSTGDSGRNQDGDNGGKRQGGARSRISLVGTQSTARTMAHSGVEGGRSHGGALAVDTREAMDRDGAMEVEPWAQTESDGTE